jgi:Protein of unknown function (DUF2877)
MPESQSQSLGLTPFRALRVSRCVRERLHGGARAVVRGVQRRACQLAVEDGSLLVLSTADVPLAPNALAVDIAPDLTMPDAGFRPGSGLHFQATPACWDGRTVWKSRPDPVVSLGAASIWEPHPEVHRLASEDVAHRVRTARATLVAEGARESLLPALWASERVVFQAGFAGAASLPARLLCDAAAGSDPSSLAQAARGLAGIGPGLTPSGDDFLAGFAAAWTLVGASLGLDGAACRRVTDALLAGAARGASPLGRAWLEHACRGELLEPMTRFVGALLADGPRDVAAAARGALAVGSSSGTDWMVGFVLGARATLDSTTSWSW